MIDSGDTLELKLKRIAATVLHEKLPTSSFQYLTDLVESFTIGTLDRQYERLIPKIDKKQELTVEEYAIIADYLLINAAEQNREQKLTVTSLQYEECIARLKDNSNDKNRYQNLQSRVRQHFKVLRHYFGSRNSTHSSQQKHLSEREVKQNAFRRHLSDLKRAFLETDHFQIEKSSYQAARIMENMSFDSIKIAEKLRYAQKPLLEKLDGLYLRSEHSTGKEEELLKKEIAFYRETIDYGRDILKKIHNDILTKEVNNLKKQLT